MDNIISINNINVSFKENIVLKNSKIDIKNKTMTAIIGDSGSGKTTLLYTLGLISSSKDYDYYFYGEKIDIKNDNMMSEIRKNKIAYVFQDNNLIEDLTVIENIKLICELSNIKIDENNIERQLNLINLDLKFNAYIRNLSGGERQRLAIIIAFIKDPDVIIADEPTSALDEENIEILFNLFQKFLKKENKAIIIATHSQDIYDKCDIVYKIENKEIIQTKNNTTEENTCQNNKIDNTKISYSFYLKYLKNIKNKSRFIKNGIAIFCAIVVIFLVAIYYNGYNNNKIVTSLINNTANKEIFVANNTLPINEYDNYVSNVYHDYYLSIKPEIFSKIENINGITSIYPFMRFSSYGVNKPETRNNYIFDFEGDVDYLQTKTEISILKNKKEISKVVFDYMPQDESEEQLQYSVWPYYEEQHFESQSKLSNSEIDGGIYISETMAKKLKITSIKDIELIFDMYVPTLQYTNEFEMSHFGSDSLGQLHETENVKYDAKDTVNIKTTQRYHIKGIVYDFSIPKYIDNDLTSHHIFIPINDAIKSIEESADSSYLPVNYYGETFPSEKWIPSTYSTFVSDFSEINMISEDIESINNTLITNKTYQNIEKMQQTISEENKFTNNIIIISSIIVILLICLIFVNDILKRRYEISILRSNGFSRKEINKLFMLEAFFFLIKIFLLSLILSFFVVIFLKNIILELNIFTILLFFIASIIAVIIPYIISLFALNRLSPDEILRN